MPRRTNIRNDDRGHVSLSRRAFVLTAAGSWLVPRATTAASQTAPLTAALVADRIRANVGVPWRDATTDGFKAGDPATVVTGITTTAMATMDVLRRTAAAGRKLVITQEPVFYTANDAPGPRDTDPVYLAKRAFIEAHGLVIWRFSDHWTARRQSDISTALAAMLGWHTRLPDADAIYQIPDTTFGALTRHVRARLNLNGGLRIVGKQDMTVRSVFVSPGTTGVPSTLLNLGRADVVIAGEPREWEVVPYVLDTWSAGHGKGLISVGRVVSEGPGMQACAAWLRTLIPGIPVEADTIADPYWSPAL